MYACGIVGQIFVYLTKRGENDEKEHFNKALKMSLFRGGEGDPALQPMGGGLADYLYLKVETTFFGLSH